MCNLKFLSTNPGQGESTFHPIRVEGLSAVEWGGTVISIITGLEKPSVSVLDTKELVLRYLAGEFSSTKKLQQPIKR